MIRPVLTEIALFLAPFALFAVFLWATQAGALDRSQWTLSRVAWLLMVSLLLMIGSFVVLAHWGTVAPNSTYIPAHYENGVLVPGQTK